MAHALRNEVTQFLAGQHRHLIDGEWRDSASGKTFQVYDPATGKPIASVAEGAAAEIDLAVSAARRSFADRRWRGLTGDARARILWRFAELMERDATDLAQLEVANNGMPIANGAMARGYLCELVA